MHQIIQLLAPLARQRAYLDPGSGSILLQLLVAAALGAAFAIKVYWKKIKVIFKKKDASQNAAEQPEQAVEQPKDEK